MSQRVLIAEDHALMRQGLRAMVESIEDCTVVAEAADGRDAITKTLHHRPDLVLMDLSLPGMSGIDAALQIRRRQPQQKVLALGEQDSGYLTGEVQRAGCLGFVTKDCPKEELSLAIRTVLEGRRFLGQALATLLLDGLAGRRGGSGKDAVWDALSSRERTVFKLIAEGCTNRSAADYLNLSAKTIEKHRANLMRKLNLNSAVELALLAVDLGLVDRPLSRGRGNGAPMSTT
jgi:DNA-binding NarL/FixJ family response regulator